MRFRRLGLEAGFRILLSSLLKGAHSFPQPNEKAALAGRLTCAFRQTKTGTGKLEPVQESSIHAHIVLVGNARKTEHHPVELDGTENQLVFSEVCTAAEHHRHAAVAEATARSMGAAKQSMCIRREASLMGRHYRPKGVSVEIRARVIYAAEIRGCAHPASEVQVGGSVPSVGMPSAVGAGELVASVNFWLRRFLSHSQTRNHAN